MREALFYRHLHGAPQVMGVPVHQMLALVAVGTIGALVVNQWSGAAAIVFALAAVVLGVVLQLINAQDRIVLPVVKLRLLNRFQQRVSSYAPSYQHVEWKED
jgi:type IV secretory pathway VirB3-like protein